MSNMSGQNESEMKRLIEKILHLPKKGSSIQIENTKNEHNGLFGKVLNDPTMRPLQEVPKCAVLRPKPIQQQHQEDREELTKAWGKFWQDLNAYLRFHPDCKLDDKYHQQLLQRTQTAYVQLAAKHHRQMQRHQEELLLLR